MTTKKKPTIKTLTVVDEKQLTTEKARASKAISYATELVVATKEDYDTALERGKVIKTMLESVTARREEITKPINDALKSTRALFKPIESGLEDALITIKSKMMTWFSEEKRREQAEHQKLADRVDRGTMKPETAVKKAVDIEAPVAHTKTETATGTVRTVRKVRIVNLRMVPITYLVPDMVLIRKDALAGKSIPGVEVYEDYEQAIG